MRVVICWGGISGYLAASWRALNQRDGMNLRLVVFPALGGANAPFGPEVGAGLPVDLLEEKYIGDAARVAALVAAHDPDVIVIPGWRIPAFRKLVDDPRFLRVKFVMAMDTPRKPFGRDNLLQWIRRFTLRRFLSRMDRVVVPGERSWQFARFLGFSEARVRRGVYGVDVARLAPLHEQRAARADGWPRRFVFVGRYEAVKGVDVLLDAYTVYRQQVKDPWPLACCGKGPMAAAIARTPGVEDCGFVQPADQPAMWLASGVFVLASRYEPWGAVVAEAGAAGLPMVCTEACGAAVELVQTYFNGLKVASGDRGALTRALIWLHEHEALLPEFGRRSRELAAAYSAELWAERWFEMCRELLDAPIPVKSS